MYMPTKNSRKKYADDQYYHVYTRGINKQILFHEEKDYAFFLSLFKRYLSNEPLSSPYRTTYPWYGDRIKLITFCLMPNHVHMLLYQADQDAMKELLHSIMTSYSMFYNQKYKHYGPVFQSRYLANLIDKDNYLTHVSRYIHLNPNKWSIYPYSSIKYYRNNQSPEWLHTSEIKKYFDNLKDYFIFLNDYQDHKEMLDEIKYELAHS